MELLTSLAAPVITGAVTLIGIIIANRKAEAVREVEERAFRERIENALEECNKRLDSHNSYAELFNSTSAEQSIVLARIDERLKALEGKQ